MSTSKVTYLGGLRTQSTHLASGNSYLTDAPIDNQGKGEAFSPTDTVATGLANCMLTVMGIKAASLHVDLEGTEAAVTKVMVSDPRRISEINVVLSFPKGISEKHQKILENTALTCPVAKSLHPDIVQNIQFQW
ncbi:MAG: OsmC family protein [Flavobacteriaceae bacterium]